MIENKSHTKIETSSERNFGIVFSLFFLIIAIYPLFFSKTMNYWALIFSIVLVFISFFFEKILVIPNKIWNKIGFLMGAIVSPIVMILIFILTFLPIGLFFRMIGKDLINQKINKQKKTYWIKRKHKMESFNKQF